LLSLLLCFATILQIKPQNIFLESKDSHSAIKIGDFGFAKKVHTPKSLTSRCGTPSYVAPEILKNQPYDQSCDMWSVGVVLYVMLCGYTPFSDENQERMFERIKLGEWKFEASDWLHVSSEAKDLIEQCICTNVDKRITAAQALKSRWIAGLTDQQLSSNDLSFTSQTIKKAPKLSDIAKSFMALRSGANKAKGGLSAIASSALYSVSTAGSATASRPEKSEYTTTTSSARHVV
jgi:serine/threonine protein kinase